MSKKIFIVEDDANILFGLQAKFSIEGLQTATNSGNIPANDIVNEIIKFKPDYIIQDLILPKVDGFDIIKALQENDNTKSIPVFVFTSLSDSDSKNRGMDLGVKHYFIKDDFNIDSFVEKVVKIISNRDKVNI